MLGLMVCNAVVANLRSTTKDNSDNDFLLRLLKFSLGKFEANVTKGWGTWVEALTWTLIEWKQNYKIDGNLNASLRKMTQGKERPSLRDAHFTALTDQEAVENLLRRTASDVLTVHLLRVWECCFSPSSDQGKDALTAVLLPGWNNEGWECLVGVTTKYVKSFYAANPTGVLLKTSNDKFSALITNFVKSHSAIFVESSVGETVRSLAATVHTSVKEFLKSPLFREAVETLLRFMKYTLENMHTLTPVLARFLCLLCDLIREAKGSEDYWQELCALLVLRVLTMAISNPLVYGVTDTCGTAAMNVLKEMGRLLHHIWLGKSVDTGDLSGVPWLNDTIPQWQTELKAALASMLVARKAVPKAMVLPRALIMYDLTELAKSFQSCSLPLSRFPESPSIVKLKSGKSSPKPPLPGKKKETAEELWEETDIVTFGGATGGQTLLVDDGQILGTISKVKKSPRNAPKAVELLEESTPSMPALPPVFGFMAVPQSSEELVITTEEGKSSYVKPLPGTLQRHAAPVRLAAPPKRPAPSFSEQEVQTLSGFCNPKTTQTEGTELVSKFIQVHTFESLTQSSQTDPSSTSPHYKLRSYLKDEVYVKDKEIETYFSWEQIAADKAQAEAELGTLRGYQRVEESRIQRMSDDWSNRFQTMRRENVDLKEELQALKEEIERMQRVKEDSPKTLRSSYADFSETLRGQFFIDERLLKKMDPRNYIPGDFSKTAGAFASPAKSRRQNSVSFLK